MPGHSHPIPRTLAASFPRAAALEQNNDYSPRRPPKLTRRNMEDPIESHGFNT